MVEQGKSNGIFDFTKEHPTLTAHLLLSKFYSRSWCQRLRVNSCSQCFWPLVREVEGRIFMIREVLVQKHPNTVCILLLALFLLPSFFIQHMLKKLGPLTLLWLNCISFFSFGRPEPNEWHLTSARKDVPLISLFILENVPMLHSMAMSTYHTLAHDHPQAVIPTVLALYTTASLLTALAFILLGYFKMQHLCNALPKPVLMGCLAGMGIYLFACGLGTSTAVEWDWTSETLVEQTRHWPKLLLTLGLEAVLLQALAMAKRIDLEALVLPTFFLATWPWHKFWWRVSFSLGVGGAVGRTLMDTKSPAN